MAFLGKNTLMFHCVMKALTCLLFNENRVNNNAFSSFVHVLSVRKLKRLINQYQTRRSLLKRFFLEDECV